MPFTIANLNQQLLLDNPTFERIINSDLHALVALLRQVPATWTAALVAAEMKKVSAAKWIKYAGTRRYLEAQIPTLTSHLRATPIGFTTIKMSSELVDTILRHTFKWTSDTGNMGDLAAVVTREYVTWGQWPVALTACIGLPHGAAYTHPGHHGGLAANPANLGKGQDDHALMGPFSGAVLNFAGAATVAPMDQVYQYSYDRINWLPIPGSTFTIVREVRALGGGRVQLKLIKTNTTKPADTFTVTKIF